MVTSESGATVNVSGGQGTATGNQGGPGRFLLGSNTVAAGTDASGAFGGTVMGAQASATFAGSMSTNLYIAGKPMTANIPDLIGGADAFGIWDNVQASDILEFSGAPSNQRGLAASDENWASVHPGPFNFFDARHPGLYTQFPGYDLLLFANLLSVDQIGDSGSRREWLFGRPRAEGRKS